jgi:hypothetical protein
MDRRQTAIVMSSLLLGGLIRKRQKLTRIPIAKLTPELEDELRSLDLTIRLLNPMVEVTPKFDERLGVHADDTFILRLLADTPSGATIQKLAIALASRCDLPTHDLKIVRRVALGVTAAINRLADQGEVLVFHTGSRPPVCTVSPLGEESLEVE